ncbi:MAG TPA: sporulation transcription factor Spo0A [Proteiniclasticum sp.]|uniref:sporulation transcription factor Spo0A n=1 Tax=Proteiniclasticum sp. TaxID=2053595 RepID=UPI000E837DDC|nr:sporulation transcription factor Spo0A [Proteiniclasticum sp.]HBW13434.1 sporulation transcription factor Spo0A [Proteiniclasticum sp.]
MKKLIKILIADDNADMSALLNEFLSNDPELLVVGVAKNGIETLEIMQQKKPDVLLLDIIMPELDGLGVLESLKNMEDRPVIIVYSAISHDKVTNTAITLGADYYMVKGIDLKQIKKRIKSYFHESQEEIMKSQDMKSGDFQEDGMEKKDLATELSSILQEAGILPHIKGYSYLREAIIEVIDNVELLSAVTKELYPNIAAKFNTTSSRVERAIRHSIEVSWNKGQLENLNKIQGFTVNFEKGKPTNSEFIALISDKFRLEKGQGDE